MVTLLTNYFQQNSCAHDIPLIVKDHSLQNKGQFSIPGFQTGYKIQVLPIFNFIMV